MRIKVRNLYRQDAIVESLLLPLNVRANFNHKWMELGLVKTNAKGSRGSILKDDHYKSDQEHNGLKSQLWRGILISKFPSKILGCQVRILKVIAKNCLVF